MSHNRKYCKIPLIFWYQSQLGPPYLLFCGCTFETALSTATLYKQSTLLFFYFFSFFTFKILISILSLFQYKLGGWGHFPAKGWAFVSVLSGQQWELTQNHWKENWELRSLDMEVGLGLGGIWLALCFVICPYMYQSSINSEITQ